jgi:hypothetical protein
MKKTLLTIAVSMTLATAFSQAAEKDCMVNAHANNDRQQAMQARFEARRAEMQKMHDMFRQNMPVAPVFQPAAQNQDWSKIAEQQRQQMEAQIKAQQEQFAAAQKQHADYLKQMQEQVAQYQPAVQMPSFADVQKAQQAHFEQMRAQQEKYLQAMRQQAAQYQPATYPFAGQNMEDVRKAHKEFAENMRKQQAQQFAALEEHMKQFMPGLQTVSFADAEALRSKTPEQRHEYSKNLAEKQKTYAQALFAKQADYVKSMQEQFEQFSPVAHMPMYKDMQVEMQKHRAAAEKRRNQADARYQARQACMNKI